MSTFNPDRTSAIETPVQGARVTDDGVSYRIWAPRHSSLSVRIRRRNQTEELLPMLAEPEGFFAVNDRSGRAGDRYLYVLPDGSTRPDPVSRYQPEGVHGWSECIDPRSYAWRCADWQRPGWHGQSIYELHVGTFTPGGMFCSAIQRIYHIAELGVEAIEIMPVADFPGERNWGYDGVALFAPARCYGRPNELRALVDAAHERGLAVILDVVYNHLGPDGNYLGSFSDDYFHHERGTPWGAGFNLDGPNSKPVRDLFLSNAAYWLDEYRLDGLRLDATHAMRDDSPRHLLAELADLAHARGAFLIAEDDRNSCGVLTRPDGSGAHIDAAWADDFHHQVRVALTGEQEGYFQNYRGTAKDLARTLDDGWFYTGQAYFSWKGRPRGESCRHLPPAAFVTCIENHDQVGNRAKGERLEHLIAPAAFRAASSLLCLTPYAPLIFMGQEWAASAPFLYFTDHAGELGRQVSVGRQKEFASAGINQKLLPEEVPDPQLPETFIQSQLRWDELRQEAHAEVLHLYRHCLGFRRTWLRGRTLDRDAWSVGAVGNSVAIRYHGGDQPERLVVSALVGGDTKLLLETEPLLRPPDGYVWQLEFESEGCFVATMGLTAPQSRVVESDSGGPVTTLVLESPVTVLLVAQPQPRTTGR